MHWAVLFGAVAALYLLRDSACLAQRVGRRQTLFAYAGALLVRSAALGGLAERLGRDEVLGLLQKPAVWAGLLLVQVLTAAALLTWKHRLPAIAVLLAPAPMEWLAAGGLIWLIVQSPLLIEGWAAGLALAAAWLGAALLIGRLWQPDGERAVRTAATANVSAILPLALQVRGASAAPSEAAWQPVSLLPLLPVAGLVASGWLLQRLRRRSHERAV